ncbi:LAQU0S02e02850g1_1 [Lachancea quebecensis]|uniref:LAQU0S02e02850g1_1 n=1 Tax=Lachancea quebecensis TaxID=1654605 RepID=A0A0P1KND8_9SACH|nr:LAQU0S02e02850g1_1 [Lachancea quebecensis]
MTGNTDISYSSSSEDFTKLEEAPKYRETPDLLNFDQCEANSKTKRANPLLRRRSTNYSDALELERHLPAAIANDLSVIEGRGTKPMNEQFFRRNLQEKSENLRDADAFYRYDCTQAGPKFDYAQGSDKDLDIASQSRSQPRSQPQLQAPVNTNGITFCSEGKKSDMSDQRSSQRPSLHQRSSSKFEDYKKDIYDRLHLFNE